MSTAQLGDEGRVRLAALDGDFIPLASPYPFGAPVDTAVTPVSRPPSGEPVDLPADFYEPLSTPSGGAIVGWRLTAAGRAAKAEVQAGA
ncbi:hypothetical protein [Croceicoccus sp. YJ47]|uniref:hypothetical protein n=1 Tax=Croceicoccus sp. YJ47 TaxID=2798724 RepID=UPI0019217762|nr:hypothetical protein [Croceicoccus sp. YJ47]QQN73162.1 hypothetical protein JD971_09805 [Croceicoccus sp. YJ47]